MDRDISDRSESAGNREAKRQALLDALIAGENSGAAQSFDPDAFLVRMHEHQPRSG